MIFLVPESVEIEVFKKHRENLKSFLDDEEVLKLNYVFYFPTYKMNIVYPKVKNFLYGISDTFYVSFPRFIVKKHDPNFDFSKLRFRVFDFTSQRILELTNTIVSIEIEANLPSFFYDFVNIIYNSQAITNFWSDLYFVSNLLGHDFL